MAAATLEDGVGYAHDELSTEEIRADPFYSNSRYNSLAPERALAFAMGSLERLANLNSPNSFSYVNMLDANLVRMIVDLCKVYFDRDSMEGVVRLLGACFK